MFTLFAVWIRATLSRLAIAWALTLIGAAAFLRQLMNFVLGLFELRDVAPFVLVFFLAAGAGAAAFARRAGRPILPGLVVFGAGLAFSLVLDMAVERVHLVFYGLLGFLGARDAHSQGWPAFLPVLMFCVAVAALDELFQYFLPYRVGDPRDVFLGLAGGVWGIALFIAAGRGRANRRAARSRSQVGRSG